MSVRPPLRLHDRDGQGFPNFEFFGFDYQMPSIERPKVQVRRRRRRSRDNLKDNLNPVGASSITLLCSSPQKEFYNNIGTFRNSLALGREFEIPR